MKPNIRPASLNNYPKNALLIKGATPNIWLTAIQAMQLRSDDIISFVVPTKTPNEIFGCFVYLKNTSLPEDTGQHIVLQSVHDYLFIPEYSVVHPLLHQDECKSLFGVPHLFHPDIGWFELKDRIDWTSIVGLPNVTPVNTIAPAKTIKFPTTVKSVQVFVKPIEDIAKSLGVNENEEKNTPLSSWEKTKLNLFKSFYNATPDKNGNFQFESKGLFKWLNRNSKTKGEASFLGSNMEQLFARNQKEADKLLALFKSNPALALRFSIPIDSIGASRGTEGSFSLFGGSSGENGTGSGTNSGLFKFIFFGFGIYALYLLSQSINTSSNITPSTPGAGTGSGAGKLFLMIVLIFILLYLITGGNSKTSASRDRRGHGGGGTSISLENSRVNRLREEYTKMANQYLEQGDHQKAAEIHIKLLKDYRRAATILEEGDLYQEAAYIHLKFLNDKWAAARCYETGKFYHEAIKIYKELNAFEKLGDLHRILKEDEEADRYYNIIIDKHLEQQSYHSAATIYKDKMFMFDKAQETLLKGWCENLNPTHCLKNYFSNITDPDELSQAIEHVYQNHLITSHEKRFLKILKYEYKRTPAVQPTAKSIIYELVSKMAPGNPYIVNELKVFGNNDKHLLRDISSFINRK